MHVMYFIRKHNKVEVEEHPETEGASSHIAHSTNSFFFIKIKNYNT